MTITCFCTKNGDWGLTKYFSTFFMVSFQILSMVHSGHEAFRVVSIASFSLFFASWRFNSISNYLILSSSSSFFNCSYFSASTSLGSTSLKETIFTDLVPISELIPTSVSNLIRISGAISSNIHLSDLSVTTIIT